MADIHFEVVQQISNISANEWNGCFNSNYPFTQHAFLNALETSGCVSKASGWEPRHIKFLQDGKLIGVLPAYLKHHSYGEYVFDWSWADAYHRYGVNYYPKLISAIPFTPATGPRFGVTDTTDLGTVLDSFSIQLPKILENNNASGFHCLFPTDAISEKLIAHNLQQRLGCQYHWFNQNYDDFDHFLESFTSRKRKNLKKERKAVHDQHLILTRKTGNNISPQDWEQFYQFYHMTYFKRSGRQGYLNQAFFNALASDMTDQIMMVVATLDGQTVAASLFFYDEETLYGRYWGCYKEFDYLHFEACYYQGIEFAIERGLKKFDPGAQGEHKIQRGFTPVLTYSNHWLKQAEFNDAIRQFLQQEAGEIKRYAEAAQDYLPFKQRN